MYKMLEYEMTDVFLEELSHFMVGLKRKVSNDKIEYHKKLLLLLILFKIFFIQVQQVKLQSSNCLHQGKKNIDLDVFHLI